MRVKGRIFNKVKLDSTLRWNFHDKAGGKNSVEDVVGLSYREWRGFCVCVCVSGLALQIQCYQCEMTHDCSTPEFIVNCTVNVQDMCQKEVLVKEDGRSWPWCSGLDLRGSEELCSKTLTESQTQIYKLRIQSAQLFPVSPGRISVFVLVGAQAVIFPQPEEIL